MDDSLLDYCSSQPGMLVIPIEALSENGLDPDASTAYQARGLLSNAECERIDTMVVAYWKRAAVLGRASRQWFPPRLQHLCLVGNGVRTRPYFQPFHASSWLLYRDDIAEATSSLEFAIFLLFQVERQYLQQQVGASLLANLPYLLILNEPQLEDFLAGCGRSTRPDADGYRALAEAMPVIRTLHNPLSKRPRPVRPGSVSLSNGLDVTPEEKRTLDALHRRWMDSVEAVMTAHCNSAGNSARNSAAPRSAGAGRTLFDWLESEAPELVLTGEGARPIWAGPGTGTPELDALLARVSPAAETSILEDLKVVDRKSRAFLESLTAPEELARPASWMTEGGLSYIHGDTLRIAYSLTDDPDRLRHAAPPYERLMLAARTIHEWGHQAAESGWIRVDSSKREERQAIERELVDRLDRIVDELPAAVRPAMVAALGPMDGNATAGGILLKGLMRRIDDYQANLLARHFLTDPEMDTYVRNNVGSRLLDYAPEQALTHLVRLAYEFQYLQLSTIRDPEAWFLKSSWFEALFVAPGLLATDTFFCLADVIRRICMSFAVDADRIRLPDRAP